MWVAIIALVIAVLLVVFYKPKTPDAPDNSPKTPEVLDGRKIRRIYGTVWIEDPTIIGWKLMGTIPIKSEGKK